MPASRNKSGRFQPAPRSAESGANPPNNPGTQTTKNGRK